MSLSSLKPLNGSQSSQDEVKGLRWGHSRPLQPGPAGHDQSPSPPCAPQTPSCQPHTPTRQEPCAPSNARLCALLVSSHKAAPTQHTPPCVKGLSSSRPFYFLNVIPYATREALVVFLFYIEYCKSINPQLLIYPSPTARPMLNDASSRKPPHSAPLTVLLLLYFSVALRASNTGFHSVPRSGPAQPQAHTSFLNKQKIHQCRAEPGVLPKSEQS